MSYITVQEAAERWHVSERRVQMFCREGRIQAKQRLDDSRGHSASG